MDAASDPRRQLLRRVRLGLGIAFALLLAAAALLGRCACGRVERAASVQVPGERIDINTATVGELALLPGVGEGKAAAIVAHRNAHGPFASVDALIEVKGIGTQTLDAMRPQVVAIPPP